jgi:hypothetical protein
LYCLIKIAGDFSQFPGSAPVVQITGCTVVITGSLDEVVELGWLHAKMHHEHNNEEETERPVRLR